MSADRLREAAALLRERAKAATPGDRWNLRNAEFGKKAVHIEYVRNVFAVAYAGTEANATYIATMSPPVALALADYLDAEALHDDRWQQAKREVVTSMLAFEGSTLPEALAVADAILGADR